MIFWSVTPLKNVTSIQKQGLEPKIGDRSELCQETEPAIYMFQNKQELENALMNWLGEELEDSPLAIMKISLPPDYLLILEWEAFEVRCKEKIPPKYIEFFEENILIN